MLEKGGPSIGGSCVTQEVFSDTCKVAYVLAVPKKAIFVQKYMKYLMVSILVLRRKFLIKQRINSRFGLVTAVCINPLVINTKSSLLLMQIHLW